MPLSAGDRFALLDPIARANWAADAKDVRATAATYTGDGRITGAFQAHLGPGFLSDLERIFRGEGSAKRHALPWMMAVFEAETDARLVATCKVKDQFQREDGRWLIAHHDVQIDPRMKIDVGQVG